MKPDGALAGEMDEADVVPSELFAELGMLVIESRVPQYSPKGRVQGPHCPVAVGELPKHHCDSYDLMCQRAAALQRQMQMLWKNRIPMCIEVLLYPECEHGRERATSADQGQLVLSDNCLLLERWTVQVLPKRSADGCPVRSRELFQAIKSYLFFSQLSAWFNRSHGANPSNISYRISPPGEFCTSSFNETPEWHIFPVSTVSKSMAIKITVGSLPRHEDVIHVPCPMHKKPPVGMHVLQAKRPDRLDTMPSYPIRTRKSSPPLLGGPGRESKSPSPPGAVGGFSPKLAGSSLYSQLLDADQSGWESPLSSLGLRRRKKSIQPMQSQHYHKRLSAPCAPSLQESTSPQAEVPLPEPDDVTIQRQKQTGAIPKKTLRKSPTLCLEHHSLSAPEIDNFEAALPVLPWTKPSTSPRVLMTKKSPGQGYYQKDRDPWSAAVQGNKDSTDSDQSSSPEIDKFLKNFGTRFDPLSPQEIQNYLASLSSTSRSRKEYTPSPSAQLEIKFSALEDEEDHINKKLANLTASKLKLSPSSSPVEAKAELLDKDSLRDRGSSSPSDSLTPVASPRIQKEPTTSPVISPRGTKGKRAMSPLTRQLENLDIQGQRSTSPESEPIDKVQFSIGEVEVPDSDLDLDDDEQNGVAVASTQNGSAATCSRTEQNGTHAHAHVSNGATPSVASSGLPGTGLHKEPEPPCTPDAGDERPLYHKSKSDGGSLESLEKIPGFTKGKPLLHALMKRDLAQQLQEDSGSVETLNQQPGIPTPQERASFRKSLESSAGMIFHAATGLPLQSSPAPIKKRTSDSFDYDCSLTSVRAIKNSLSCVNLEKENKDPESDEKANNQRFYSASAPASTNCLLGNFEESLLNGRIEPSGVVDGFRVEIGASGVFCPKHINLPVTAFFFSLSDDNAPSPYLGHVNLEQLTKRGYHVPRRGTVQVTLFNPNNTVVKMFVVMYDLSDMPANCQTFLRQRTLYMPVQGSPSDLQGEPAYLRYLIHLRFCSSKSGKIYLHTDIRLIFARDKFEFDSRVANYELRSFTEGPTNPKFSPKR